MIHLVAGGAGFIGSWLCEALISRGDRVICVDNFFTGRKENIEHLLDNPHFELIRSDISDLGHVWCDRIWNLACPASPPRYQFDPIQTMRTCVHGSMNLLEMAARNGARILLASTSEIYGDPEQHPQRETYFGNVNPFGPRACYDEGKRAAETLFYCYGDRHDVSIRVARIFNTYGPRMAHDDGRVVSNFVYAALNGKVLKIYGDGKRTRSFCYVGDLVLGLLKLMDSDYCQPVNLGNPGEFTINDLAKKVVEMTGAHKSRIRYLPETQDDPKRRKPSIALAKKVLKWAPRVPLEDGLRMMIQDFRNRFPG